MRDLDEMAKELEAEAAKILDMAFLDLPMNTSSGASARLVECIVSAAVLRITKTWADAARTANQPSESRNG